MAFRRRNYKKSRRPARRMRRPRRKSGVTGGFIIKRRIPLFAVRGNGSGGVVTSNTTVCVLGSAVASVNGIANYIDIPFALELHLNDLDAVSDLTNICDKYKIMGAQVKITTANSSSVVAQVAPFIEGVRDSDDSTAPSVSMLNQKMGLFNKGFNQRGQCSLSLRPTPAQALFNTSLTSGYAIPRSSPYINTNYDAVPHYCFKGIIRNLYSPASGSIASFLFDIVMKVHCKDLQ